MQIGDRLPDLSAPATGERTINLRDHIGAPLLIYFYPRDATPGCTRQAQELASHHDQLTALGVQVLGVSRDTLASHERFSTRHALPFALLSDEDGTLCQAFDVLREKNMYGRKFIGIERSTFLFAADGTLAQAWRKVKVPGHAEAVLAAAQELV
ncbi:MAG: peroxiredoxin [Xanthomonadales bacterium]|nr:peroxiredoxin [Xanthomonadales bacterium]